MFLFDSFNSVADLVKKEAEKIGFNKDNPHVKKIAKKYEDLEDKKPCILDFTRRRYNLHSYRATHCHNYNANELTTNIWIGEGPYKNGSSERVYDNHLRFCHSILQNRKIKFTTIVAIGPSIGLSAGPSNKPKVNFTSYFNPLGEKRKTQQHYQFITKPINTEQADFHLYSMGLKRKGIFQKELALAHLPQMEDMKILETSDQLIYQLILLANKSKNEAIFIHCSAGLGRSGTLALALTLFLRHEELSKIDDLDKLVGTIVSIWNDFNKIRPGTIQTSAQLTNALQIADEMWDLQLSLDKGYVLGSKEESSSKSYSSGFFTSHSARLTDEKLTRSKSSEERVAKHSK